MKEPEVEVLRGVCDEVEAEGRMTKAHLTRLSAAFGPRFAKAQEALRESRVKRYVFKPSGRVVWVVVGRERDYLVMPDANFCSCEDFYFKFDRGHLCYHILAQKLAEATGQFDLIEGDDRLYETLMGEWKTVGQWLPKGFREGSYRDHH